MKNLKAAKDRQKFYADLKRRHDELAVGDYVMRFGTKRKLSPKFIGPYEVTGRVGKVSYRLALPNELGKIH